MLCHNNPIHSFSPDMCVCVLMMSSMTKKKDEQKKKDTVERVTITIMMKLKCAAYIFRWERRIIIIIIQQFSNCHWPCSFSHFCVSISRRRRALTHAHIIFILFENKYVVVAFLLLLLLLFCSCHRVWMVEKISF